jgi:hypothetical protein
LERKSPCKKECPKRGLGVKKYKIRPIKIARLKKHYSEGQSKKTDMTKTRYPINAHNFLKKYSHSASHAAHQGLGVKTHRQ